MAPEDRNELECFKRNVDLSAFAASKGYTLDKRESSANCRVMRHPGTDDKIIVGKGADGHWQYFSVRDRDDNGSIIDFVQNRAGGRVACPVGAVRKELREWTHTERPRPEFARTTVQPATKSRAAVALEVACSKLLATHPYLEARGLSPETLSNSRFHGTWRQSAGPHGNVIFLHHDNEGLSGFEVKNSGFTGFARGGDKGLWSSKGTCVDNRLVIAESAIDALSYHQVNPHPKTRYVSFGGGQNPRQAALLESAISWMPAGSTIVAATDKDKAGIDFARQIYELCAEHPHCTFERHAPKLGKDWNDHLQALRSPTRSSTREPNKHPGLDR
jgi:hypothetical protein